MRFPYPLSRRSRLSALVCSLWLLFWLPVAVWAGGFALQINDESGLDEPWPLVAGLPFPEGELHDAEQIRILDATGAQVPAQMDVAATWRDGSLRWVQAGFTASPQGAYRVEYGEHVYGSGAASTDAGLRVYETADGVTVDTGAAVYEFLGDRLLPETARMGGTEFLSGSGDGAYLVDNQGRLARVAGAAADVTSTIVKQGTSRAVLRREGWYVTETGERVARTQAWFYFAAGTPYLRVTHSLIFTEDTNDLWVRDYGLEFRTPSPPSEALFALGDDSEFGESLLSMQPVVASRRELVSVGSDEVFMLQDDFPHFLERESRAGVGRAAPLDLGGSLVHRANLDSYEALQSAGAVGDWADGQFESYGLTVVMPWLAQRFPKDIAFGPDGARAAFWSGRSGRELDFRAATLVNEYWQSWANYSPDGSELANAPSNAQGAARTHDLWLLPRMEPGDQYWREPRAKAASQPPLVLADPAWLTATEAMGWPSHPVDTENFPEEEAVLSDFWDDLMNRYEALRRTGFISWGDTPHINGATSTWFRVSGSIDYLLRQRIWNLYARSGDRRYLDYGTRYNRFYSDWKMAHHAAPNKFVGGIGIGPTYDTGINRPLYWGTDSSLIPNGPHEIVHWLLEYYLTGDERAFETTRLIGEAFKSHWSDISLTHADGIAHSLRVLSRLYTREWDEEFGAMAKDLADWLIDLNKAYPINDNIRFSPLYKPHREIFSIYDYFRATGDENARNAFLQAVEFFYRFNYVGSAFYQEQYPGLLFAAAYHLTEDANYLRVLHSYIKSHRNWAVYPRIGTLTYHPGPAMGLSAALSVLSKTEEPNTAYPIVRKYNSQINSKIVFRKLAGESVNIRAHVRMVNEGDATSVLIYDADDSDKTPVANLNLQSETYIETSNATYNDLRRRSATLTVPAQEPAGLYVLEFPGSEYVDVLDTNSPQVYVNAPDGHRTQLEKVDYFWVPEGTTTLQLSVSHETEVRRSDGSVALIAAGGYLGYREVSVNGHTGVWSLIPRRVGTVQLLNIEPLFSREPRYVIPWSDASLAEPDGSTAEPDASLAEPNGSLDGSDGSTAESDGSLAEPEGSAAESDGSLAEPDGSLDGSGDSLTESDGSLDGSDGSTAESDGSLAEPDSSLDASDGPLDGSDGSPEESDAPPNAPELEVSLLRKDMRPWSE